MVVIRACNEQDVAGLLALYRELRPHDPPLVEADATLAAWLPNSMCGLSSPRWRVSLPPPASWG
jgi:hypothetical protein